MVRSQGQQYPARHEDMVQANAGYGDIDPYAQYNPAAYPIAPFGASPDGIGAYMLPSPRATRAGVLGAIANASPLIRGFRAVSGLGDDAATTTAAATPAAIPGAAPVAAVSGLLVAAVAIGLVASGVASYYVGKAVAPSRDRESEYAWWGVVAGLLGGPVGLGVEAIVALNAKGG